MSRPRGTWSTRGCRLRGAGDDRSMRLGLKPAGVPRSRGAAFHSRSSGNRLAWISAGLPCESARPDRRIRDRGGVTHHPGLLRTAPLQGETTSSLICRIASRYGMEAKALRSSWQFAQLPARARRRGRAGRRRGAAERSRTAAPGRPVRRHRRRACAGVAVLGTGGRQVVGREERGAGGGVADRRRGRGAGGVRLPPVRGPTHGNGRAGRAVRAAMGAGVRPAPAVAAGRGRRPAS